MENKIAHVVDYKSEQVAGVISPFQMRKISKIPWCHHKVAQGVNFLGPGIINTVGVTTAIVITLDENKVRECTLYHKDLISLRIPACLIIVLAIRQKQIRQGSIQLYTRNSVYPDQTAPFKEQSYIDHHCLFSYNNLSEMYHILKYTLSRI